MSDPLFSIVMPTRNRPHLLRFSLQSALEQQFDDFEVVVSDNSTNEETLELAKDFDSSRLRYVRTSGGLSMCDSWEFALPHAKGRYITYLCDDDALVPSALSQVAEVVHSQPHIELITWLCGAYTYPDWYDVSDRNELHLGPWSGRVESVDSSARLEGMYRLLLGGHPTPGMLNSMSSQRLTDRIRGDAGRVFPSIAPDFVFALSSLAATQAFLYIDRTLYLTGNSKASIGFSSLLGNLDPLREFLAEIGETDLLPDVPLKLPNGMTYCTQCLFDMQRLNARIADRRLNVDLVEYFLKTHGELRIWEIGGFDVSSEFREFFDGLAHQSRQIQRKVRAHLRLQGVRRHLRLAVNARPRLQRLESRLRGSRSSMRRFPGEEYGFSNILECARVVESLAEGMKSAAAQRHRPRP